MIKKILKFCNWKSPKSSSAFSRFFNESSSSERKKVIKKTVTAANKDQKALIEKYEEALNGSR
jgi:hypothetical protein